MDAPVIPTRAMLMCGGGGTRYGSPVEKPLIRIGGVAMVDRVRTALERSIHVEESFAVTAPHAPATAAHIAGTMAVIDAPGNGYVGDLRFALDRVDPPVVTIVADLPLVTGECLDDLLERAIDRWPNASIAVCTTRETKRSIGLGVEASIPGTDPPLVPTGINVFEGSSAPDRRFISDDVRVAVNVNRPRDAMIAEAMR